LINTAEGAIAMSTTVFISSTSRDLLDHRAAVARALLNAGYHPIDMANFMARPEGATSACLKEVAEADLFVGIYAWRYGYIPAGSAVSITEQEFIEAERLGKPCFCFMVDESYPWPETSKEPGEAAQLLRDFKSRLDARLVRTTFTTPEDLAVKVLASLQRYEREQLKKQQAEPGADHRRNSIEGRREFEAAMPKLAALERQTEVRVLIALPGSPGLRAYLPDWTEAGDVISRNDVIENEVLLEFPLDRNHQPLPVNIFVSVTAADFEIEHRVREVQISPRHDSGMITFVLTPRRPNPRALVIVEIYKDRQLSTLLGSLTLTSEIRTGAQALVQTIWQLVTQPFSLALPSGLSKGPAFPPPLTEPSRPMRPPIPVTDSSFNVMSDKPFAIDDLEGDVKIGRAAIGGDRVNVDRGLGPALEPAAKQWQQDVEARVSARPQLAPQKKAELKDMAAKVVAEVARGREVNLGRLEWLLNTMSRRDPAILEETAAALHSLLAGIGLLLQKVNGQIKLERARV
jgi:hypothetical protein